MFYEEIQTKAPCLFCTSIAIIYKEEDVINRLQENKPYMIFTRYGTFFARWQKLTFCDEKLAVFVRDSDKEINNNPNKKTN